MKNLTELNDQLLKIFNTIDEYEVSCIYLISIFLIYIANDAIGLYTKG